MSLFVVEHQHSAETCPAGNSQMAPMLLMHLSEQNAGQHGITIHGEAVIDGAHRLVLVLDGPDQSTVENYMAPFSMAGSVEVKPANKCEVVVARAGC
jgi:Domain of unknown function (DUF3303)